jgi:hypothetical protein
LGCRLQSKADSGRLCRRIVKIEPGTWSVQNCWEENRHDTTTLAINKC